jgi:hypothetical protein
VITSETRRIGLAVALIAFFMTASVWLQHVRDRTFPTATVEDESMYLTSSTTARRLSLAYQSVAADLYWIRALQYFGGTKRLVAAGGTIASPERRQFAALFPLLDLTTSLDPRFNLAYRFGAIFLAEVPPGGPGRPDLAIALLQKGLRERPDRWEYMQDIGFVNYWWRHDYRAAAEWFRRAGDTPGSPWWLRSLAATTLAEGGDRQSSRTMWEAIRQSAEIDWLRNDADRRLAQLRALDEIDALQAVVNRYSARSAQPALEWQPLINAGLLRGVPIDPTGEPYAFDQAGHVALARTSRLWPPPDEPQRGAGPPAS